MRRRTRNSLMSWAKMGGLVVVGTLFHKTIAEYLAKIPVIGEMVSSNKEA